MEACFIFSAGHHACVFGNLLPSARISFFSCRPLLATESATQELSRGGAPCRTFAPAARFSFKFQPFPLRQRSAYHRLRSRLPYSFSSRLALYAGARDQLLFGDRLTGWSAEVRTESCACSRNCTVDRVIRSKILDRRVCWAPSQCPRHAAHATLGEVTPRMIDKTVDYSTRWNVYAFPVDPLAEDPVKPGARKAYSPGGRLSPIIFGSSQRY